MLPVTTSSADCSAKPAVYCFTAFSGTGKTTFLEKLVAEMKQRNYRIGMLKMDAHHFEIDKEGKDSYRFSAAGADVVGVSCSTKTAFIEQRGLDFETLLSRFTGVDFIFVEGYTMQGYPTLTLYRAQSGNELATNPETCLAVIADAPVQTTRPVLALGDVPSVADFIVADAANKSKGDDTVCG